MQLENKTISVIIAEDEKPVAQLIEAFLADFNEVQVVKITANGFETIEEAKRLRPTVLFLDIEMPLMNGLAAAQQVNKELPNILIVFITSHTKYAADAYQLGAIDYIVKPVTSESIARSIRKIKKHLHFTENTIDLNRLLLSYNREAHLINPADIIFIEKSERTCTVHTQTRTITTTESLNNLEAKLDNQFFRCHRSFIINLNKVERIRPIAERIYEIHFYNYSKTVSMSRKKLDDFYSVVKAYFVV